MVRSRWITLLISMGIGVIIGTATYAQTELRRGVVQFNELRVFATDGSDTLSYGTLAQLQTDPNFTGNFQTIVNDASTILQGYQIVRRGGYFPENAGIPRDQQLTTDQAVYAVYDLDNGNQLVLYRSPLENTSQYFIRTSNGTLALP